MMHNTFYASLKTKIKSRLLLSSIQPTALLPSSPSNLIAPATERSVLTLPFLTTPWCLISSKFLCGWGQKPQSSPSRTHTLSSIVTAEHIVCYEPLLPWFTGLLLLLLLLTDLPPSLTFLSRCLPQADLDLFLSAICFRRSSFTLVLFLLSPLKSHRAFGWHVHSLYLCLHS